MQGGADILLVDDDDDLRELLGELLQEHGFTVAEARNGQEALAYLTAEPPPRLILLDLMMEVMGGLDFLRERGRHPHLAGLPVFLFTARDGLEDQTSQLGVDRVFRKPLVDLPTLLSAIAAVVNR